MNLSALQETRVPSLGWEYAPEKGMATHFIFLTQWIPLTEKPGWLQSMVSQRVNHHWMTTFGFQDLPNTRCVPGRKQWHPTPVLLPGKSHGWRNLVGCSPWGREESDMTERLHFHFPLSCIGEGNSNPLQCSCLENPMDGEAWWAAVYGVAQSRTRLRQLSSNISPFVL